jgi:hypothetical protein
MRFSSESNFQRTNSPQIAHYKINFSIALDIAQRSQQEFYVRAKLCLYYGDAKKFTALLSIYANSVIVCFDKSLSTLHYLAVKRCITISIHKLNRPRPSCASLRRKKIAWRAPPLLSLCAARARQNSARAPLV